MSHSQEVLYNPRPVQDVILYARKPEEYRDIPLIFRFGTALSNLSLQPWELEDKNFVPPEKWPLFSNCASGPWYELRWWLMQILWHCHLVVCNMYTTALPYSDEDVPPFPPPIEVPGESTAMFEIILKIYMPMVAKTASNSLVTLYMQVHVVGLPHALGTPQRIRRTRHDASTLHIPLTHPTNTHQAAATRIPSHQASRPVSPLAHGNYLGHNEVDNREVPHAPKHRTQHIARVSPKFGHQPSRLNKLWMN
ncbi:hypothetical protein C8J57DRAFT_1227002 [Mycena rebaudengoi]|nr:hypothetical protein C8J57DRAFT_1227002 [Mycena rebaudengoi]